MRTLVLVIAAVLLLAACGGGSAQQPPAAQPSPEAQAPTPQATPAEQAQPAAPAGEEEVKIKMTEFKFEPTTIEVKAGKVKFELENAGAVEHSFVIVGTDKKLEAVQPGESGELEGARKRGTYQIQCGTPGPQQ